MKAEELILKIKECFDKAISVKTGWGKNEIMRELDKAIMEVSLKGLDNYIEGQLEDCECCEDARENERKYCYNCGRKLNN